MPDTKQLLRDTRDRVAPPIDVLGSLERRRDERRRNQRIRAGVLGLAIAVVAGWWGIHAIRSAEHVPADDPKPPDQGAEILWPQSSREEVRQAQELADAGDPRYLWQVDPNMQSGFAQPTDETEITTRFLREMLGWEDFRFMPIPEDGFGTGASYNNAFIRCAPGETNPMYPNDPLGGGCAPTIDDTRYERVVLDLAQPIRHDESGVWVVTRWETIEPFEQVVPPTEAETTQLLDAFLQARIDGAGAEGYVDVAESGSPTDQVPLLYSTTTGVPYQRSEYEVVDGWTWPDGGEARVKVRLFAEGGDTVVEQRFLLLRDGTGSLGLRYEFAPDDMAPTTENGRVVPLEYRLLDGAVTFNADWPWDDNQDEPQGSGLITLVEGDSERFAVVVDPRPFGSGCEEGPPSADAAALVRSIRSDPNLEVSAPVAATVGGITALRMDVTTAPGAAKCHPLGTSSVVTGVAIYPDRLNQLYVLDLPGSRILAIAVAAPASSFDSVMDDRVAPILDSIEFHAS